LSQRLAAQRVLADLLSLAGVREVIVCAGARNEPLVDVLTPAPPGVSVWPFFEERDAAFFALGCSKRTRRPTALITTSGTAAGELLPGLMEAYHQGVPLVAITADRPPRLRGQMAPQATDQVGIFSRFVVSDLDLDLSSAQDGRGLEPWRDWMAQASVAQLSGPVHLNLCFDEPLLDDLPLAPWPSLTDSQPQTVPTGPVARPANPAPSSRATGALVLVLGELTVEEARATQTLVTSLPAPEQGGPWIVAEPLSLLRGAFPEREIQCADRVLALAVRDGLLSDVFRIGRVPTGRLWRDLDRVGSAREVRVESLSRRNDLGLGPRPTARNTLWSKEEWDLPEVWQERLRSACTTSRAEAHRRINEQDAMSRARLTQLLGDLPNSEVALLRALSESVAKNAWIYLGNSLPIREWDLAADRTKRDLGSRPHLSASRGLNGIDGQLSAAIGEAPEEGPCWAVLGDLTTLYNMAGPWALRARPLTDFRLAVINNSGGRIFSRVTRSPLFLNSHDLGFADWAKVWGMTSAVCHSRSQLLAALPGPRVVEIRPSLAESERFWTDWTKS
jgi:2-succinyl-5-enolpyruvyl-6-hydroxy-3-cyclohexene-1-carboxylate synthase